jgi:acylglycerol lipase
MLESSFPGVGGLSIFTRTWRPSAAPRGVVVISHGFNSHSGQYFWVADQLTAHGMAVYALDHRGRGRSDGERFFVEKFSDYEDDLTTFIAMAKAENPGLPFFLLGHSAGGVVACNYALDHQAELAGLICESFAFRVPAPDLALYILKGVGSIAPHLHVLTLKNKDFSRDPAVVESMNNDPLIAHESQPAETVAEMVRADERLEREFPQITLPVLILHGTEDHATRPDGSRQFYDNAGSTDKTLKLYEGHYHDLLNDVGKETVMGDIVSWINERIPATTSAGA